MIPKKADVVIVGGGVVGVSVAWHLASFGVRDVVLLERGTLGCGSTGASAGGIRTQFADKLNVEIALRSLKEFGAMGDAIAFHRYGYLFLLANESDLARFRDAVNMQRSLGVPSQELSVGEASAMIPQMSPEGVVGATYCEWDGYATPEAVVQWYTRELRDVVWQGVEARAINVRNQCVLGVETSAGTIATDTVVCAAGAWSAEVGQLAGVDIPVLGEARFMFFSPEDGGLPSRLPLTIDFATGFYFHREGAGLVFGGREQTAEGIAPNAMRRVPIIAELPVKSSWWGFYEQSPDHNAIVGEFATPSRFLVATGFSGHGFQQAPAVGEHLAELILGRATTLDLSPFSPERFASGKRRSEEFVV